MLIFDECQQFLLEELTQPAQLQAFAIPVTVVSAPPLTGWFFWNLPKYEPGHESLILVLKAKEQLLRQESGPEQWNQQQQTVMPATDWGVPQN